MGPGDNNLVTVAQRKNSGARKIKAQAATIRSKIRFSTGSSMRNIQTFAGVVSKMNIFSVDEVHQPQAHQYQLLGV